MGIVTAKILTASDGTDPLQITGPMVPNAGGPEYLSAPTYGPASVDFDFIGGSVSFGCYASAYTGFVLTVDGTPVTSSITNIVALNTFSICTFTGYLDDGTTLHHASLTFGTGGVGIVTGNTPASTPFTITATGTPQILAPAGRGKKYSTNTPSFQVAAAGSFGVTDGYTAYAGDYITQFPPLTQVRFSANITGINIWIANLQSACQIAVYRDDQLIVDNITVTGLTNKQYSLATGLSGMHEYRLMFYTRDISPYVSYFELVGGPISSIAKTKKPIAVWDGDSITDGFGLSGSGDMRLTDSYLMYAVTGQWPAIFGFPSQQVYTYFRDHTTDFTGKLPVPASVWFCGVINDLQGSVTQANFTSAYTTMLATARAATGYSAVPFFARGPINQTAAPGSGNTRAGFEAAIQGCATTDGNTTYVSMEGVINPATQTPDGVHPNASGYNSMFVAQSALFAATSYTFTGPTTGQVGTPQTYTVTPNGPYAGPINFGASPDGTLSVASLTWTGDASAKTLTYTPTATGTKTLTPTNSNGLTNPSAITFTATAPPDTTAPSPPGITSITVDAATVTITLLLTKGTDNVDDPSALRYDIYEDGTKIANLVAGPTYTFTRNADAITHHTISATEVDTSGNESASYTWPSAVIYTVANSPPGYNWSRIQLPLGHFIRRFLHTNN